MLNVYSVRLFSFNVLKKAAAAILARLTVDMLPLFYRFIQQVRTKSGIWNFT